MTTADCIALEEQGADIGSLSPLDLWQRRLPGDCMLLPLSSGRLLVSRDHAVFCRVPPEHVHAVRAVMDGALDVGTLDSTLSGELDRHGFFGPPRQAKTDAPSVQLQLTNACNLECRYCCTNSGKPRANEVCYERMLKLVRQIPEVLGAGTHVAILGGEPFLVPWALDLASEIMSLGLGLTVFTNGIPLANDDVACRTAALIRRGAQVRVSLAGPSAESCDALSGTARFESAVAGLRRLAVFGGRAAVDLMLVPQHVDTIAVELPRLRRTLPADTPISFGVLYVSGRETGKHLFATRADLESALDRIAFEAGESISAAARSPVANRREGCACALGQHVHVRSDGALFNCFKMEERVGHLDTLGFEAAARLIRENPHRSVDLPTCANCPLATICGAGCRSENLLYTGDPNMPPCGTWRVRVLSELLADDRVTAVDWPLAFLLHEARSRGIEAPGRLLPLTASRHLTDM